MPIGRIVVTSVGINAVLDGSCGDQLTYVPTGNVVCYWDLTAGGGGFYSVAGSTTGPLSALSSASAGATMTWTIGASSYTRTLTGHSATFSMDTGHGVLPGKPAYLQVRNTTTVVEYTAKA